MPYGYIIGHTKTKHTFGLTCANCTQSSLLLIIVIRICFLMFILNSVLVLGLEGLNPVILVEIRTILTLDVYWKSGFLLTMFVTEYSGDKNKCTRTLTITWHNLFAIFMPLIFRICGHILTVFGKKKLYNEWIIACFSALCTICTVHTQKLWKKDND